MIPSSVIITLAGDSAAALVEATERPTSESSGAATGQVVRLVGEFRSGNGETEPFTLIRKTLRPVTSGRHAPFANDPGHWAYWRRELLAYPSGILPNGPGLSAPRCYGIEGSDLYLEDVGSEPETADRAAAHLAAWQAGTPVPDFPWLTQDQLGQRLDVTDLDWSAVDADSRVVRLWDRRDILRDRLAGLPRVLSHGDYSLGNLTARGADTVAFDWSTLGIAPVGADLAHLALSASQDPTTDYLEAASATWREQDVVDGFRSTLALVGASRTHWMLSGGRDVPIWYVDFIWDHRPR